MAEAVVTGVVMGPAAAGSLHNANFYRKHVALDVTGTFIDSLRYAEPFRTARRPGSQLLEVAEGGMRAGSYLR
jgi:hypothetical protein